MSQISGLSMHARFREKARFTIHITIQNNTNTKQPCLHVAFNTIFWSSDNLCWALYLFDIKKTSAFLYVMTLNFS